MFNILKTVRCKQVIQVISIKRLILSFKNICFIICILTYVRREARPLMPVSPWAAALQDIWTVSTKYYRFIFRTKNASEKVPQTLSLNRDVPQFTYVKISSERLKKKENQGFGSLHHMRYPLQGINTRRVIQKDPKRHYNTEHSCKIIEPIRYL